ncbi:MAG TPA: 2-dehydro-3-deoxy-6-phosphogalactonate aldolase [Paucimonas sp.]|nr:2-dehydro-3-deoxy-6-phosphogalactonate aldolase [Paucimonas sp.]
MLPLLDNFPFPLVAILRGLTPAEAPTIGRILFDAGFRLIEVPLNRPGALEAMRGLIEIAPPNALVGAGTVVTRGDIDAVVHAGGRFMVAPHCDPDVIRYAVQNELLTLPGVATPTEAFKALEAGAAGLKLFPAEMMPPAVVKSLRSVLPERIWLLPVGGIHPANMGAYVDAGANGFGIGGQLYRPGTEPRAVKRAAETFMQARAALMQKT